MGAMIELESQDVNLAELPREFERVFGTIRNQQKNDAILQVLLSSYVGKLLGSTNENIGTVPGGLMKAVNGESFREFRATFYITETAIKAYPMLYHCVEPWGATVVKELPKLMPYQRALDTVSYVVDDKAAQSLCGWNVVYWLLIPKRYRPVVKWSFLCLVCLCGFLVAFLVFWKLRSYPEAPAGKEDNGPEDEAGDP